MDQGTDGPVCCMLARCAVQALSAVLAGLLDFGLPLHRAIQGARHGLIHRAMAPRLEPHMAEVRPDEPAGDAAQTQRRAGPKEQRLNLGEPAREADFQILEVTSCHMNLVRKQNAVRKVAQAHKLMWKC